MSQGLTTNSLKETQQDLTKADTAEDDNELKDDASEMVNEICSGTLLGVNGKPTDVLYVSGPPRSGKTTFALHATTAASRVTNDKARMVVPRHQDANAPARTIMSDIESHSASQRIVTTITHLAYEILVESCRYRRKPLPHFVDGVEQDNQITRILARHRKHAATISECEICKSLFRYLASAGQQKDTMTPDNGDTPGKVFERNFTQRFVSQVRRMFAQMETLGLDDSEECEETACKLLEQEAERGRIDESMEQWVESQWKAIFRLHHEYEEEFVRNARSFTVSASRLPSLAAHELTANPAACKNAVPQFLVVDDAQELTVADIEFIQALNNNGCHLMLVTGNDECAATSYGVCPELLWSCATAVSAPHFSPLLPRNFASFNAAIHPLKPKETADAPAYRDAVTTRISPSITTEGSDASSESSLPWKIIAPQESPAPDDTLHGALYHSADEETTDIVRQIRQLHIDDKAAWSEMAVVADDNATVRRVGEALRRTGVPVRFSSVTVPFAGDSLVEGLLALVELAFMRSDKYDYDRNVPLPLTDDDRDDDVNAQFDDPTMADRQRSVLMTFMTSPLVGVPTGQCVDDAPLTRPLRLHDIEAAMDGAAAARRLAETTGDQKTQADARASLYADLIRGGDSGKTVISRLKAIDGGDDVKTFCGALKWIDDVAATLESSPRNAGKILWTAWSTCTVPLVMDMRAYEAKKKQESQNKHGKSKGEKEQIAPHPYLLSKAWRKIAVSEGRDADIANEHLDMAARLFRFAEVNGENTEFVDFVERIHNTEIVADSLARKGNHPDTVTVTTPGGAVGRHWKHVWIPGVQQDVWPNITPVDSAFCPERLTDVVMHGAFETLSTDNSQKTRDVRIMTMLHDAEKSFLVALTRASCQTTVSCVWDAENVPSDFLYEFMPELFPRVESPDRAAFTTIDDSHKPVSIHEVMTAARATLAGAKPASAASRDAALSLSYLAGLSSEERESLPQRDQIDVDMADPANWPFLCNRDDGNRTGEKELITLSPSEVDALWNCPVCGMLDRELSGPRENTAATSFGTLIHKVAHNASQKEWDLPRFTDFDGKSGTERFQAIAENMWGDYKKLRNAGEVIASPESRFDFMARDREARTIIENIAHYFTDMADCEKVKVSKKDAPEVFIRMGRLVKVEPEKYVSATFGMKEITAAFNKATGGSLNLDEDQMFSLLSALVGGFPDGGLDAKTKIRISAQIDRLETRMTKSGETLYRVIDYKTGKKHTETECFNDLQLACYQLALHFNDAVDQRINVENADLFDVRNFSCPGSKSNPELYAQPGLFIDDRLTARPFVNRLRNTKGISKYTGDLLPTTNLKGLEGTGDGVPDYFVTHANSTIYWALGQIAKVFYAAAVIESSHITVPSRTPQCGKWCRHKDLCPACAAKFTTSTDTIMGRSE